MMDDKEMAVRADALRAQFQEKLDVKSLDLAQAFKRAGRRLPYGLRAQGQVLVKAQQYMAHPKLAKRVDEASVGRAFKDVGTHLAAIDVKDRRKGVWLSLAGSIVFNLLIVGVVLLVWLLWRGHI